jgi:acetoacetyl-CoA synthetase
MAPETLPLPVFTPADPDDKNVEKFRRRVNETRGLHLKDYRDLHAYSVHPNTFQQFWQDVWDFTDIKASKLSKIVFLSLDMLMKVITPNDGNWKMFPPPRFFPDARLNFAENAFAKGPANKVALIEAKEGGTNVNTVTYGQLWDKVQELASAMRNMGIEKGDRIAAILSNSINAFVIFLASISIGAIFSSSACGIAHNRKNRTNHRYGSPGHHRPPFTNPSKVDLCR